MFLVFEEIIIYLKNAVEALKYFKNTVKDLD